jgi:RND family efflux transporter MFP subunit
MNHDKNVLGRRRLLAIVVGVPLLVAAGALGMYLYLRTPRTPAPATPPAAAAATAPDPSAAHQQVELTLTPEMLSRAGIQSSSVRVGSATRELTIPGVVEPNTYRQVLVAAAAGGQVRTVPAELGAHVRQGQPLATIHSPALAEAQQVYVSMQAELSAAHQRLVRLEGLVRIGAASQQELEAAQVEHAKHATDVEGARAKLLFLGFTADRVEALVDASRITAVMTVAAPSAGVVTRRSINPGQYVDPSTELFTLADLSTVWIVGDLFERDLGRVRLGSRAAMTSAAFPGQTWKGVVTYIDAQVAPETRTARLRVETSNPGERLRLGMYLDMVISDAAPASVTLVPRTAVQTVGNQSVVYVAHGQQGGRFVERSVRLGRTSGDDVEVTTGLTEGERVVTTGSFFLRAERDRLGLPPPVAPTSPASASSSAAATRVAVRVTKDGFVPATVTVPTGSAIDLVLTRQSNETCATDVVIPALNVRKPLPLNRPVVVRIPPQSAGEIAFACGMNMLRGTVVVR